MKVSSKASGKASGLLSILALVFLLISPSEKVQAEYRVFKLGVKYHPEIPGDEEREVITSLDNYQYETYYKVTNTQQTRIISHWMCRGRTDYFENYCLEPPKPVVSPNSGASMRTPADVTQQSPSSVIK